MLRQMMERQQQAPGAPDQKNDKQSFRIAVPRGMMS
jgi:hypothetical protein